ncbi:hypothetical protein E0H82_15795 [Acinetobacter sp. ANC 4910]|uniref:hypothetical protein n=1 Tax=Acinetobacter sp. ANC 4910 TaxID=2529850 RepID=UPI00103E3C50|nr:hypothetical protein [Acinetobacter sp. ANC 4910]TCB31803.1 hypothetical protein E0H82_15795 [Acinetobacter sp. ANC 4910]
MNIIEQEPHFWELYQDNHQYYLGIAVDMSSVVSCWDIFLTAEQIDVYQQQGRESITILAKTIVDAVYRGDFSYLHQHQVSSEQTQAMQTAFQQWRAR